MTIEPWLAREPERTLDEYCFAWEGERETVRHLDGAVAHELPIPWEGSNGFIVKMRLDEGRADDQLDRLVAELETDDRHFIWIVGPSSTPADLGRRLQERGFVLGVEWNGMVLEEIPDAMPNNPRVTVEPLSEENAEEYATVLEEGAAPEIIAERASAARRFVANPRPDMGIFLGRLDGRAAGAVVHHVEPNGVAYLRNAYTRQDARGHGVYSALVTHRLQLAKQAGCTKAAVQANRETSSPILAKRGFKTVSQIYGYVKPPA